MFISRMDTWQGKYHFNYSGSHEGLIDALSTLGHEIIHAIDDCENQHGKRFIEIAEALNFGVIGKETYLSDKLHEEFIEIEEKVGRFPAVELI